MTDDKETFARRWSRLKHEQKAKPAVPEKVAETPPPSLPPVDKLTPDSDFSQFMHPKVEDALRRVALKKLFSDPHFKLADPFEPFSGDWTVADPIPEEMLATLNQAKQHLFSDKKEKEAEPSASAEAQAQTESVPSSEAVTPSKPDEPGKQDA